MRRRATGLGSIPKALVLSIAAHAALLAVATLPASAERPAPVAFVPADALDMWAGSTAELPQLYDVDVASGGEPGSESAGVAITPPPAAPPEAPAATPEEPAAPPEAPVAPPEPPKAPAAPEAPSDEPAPPPEPKAPPPRAPKPPPAAAPAEPAPTAAAEDLYDDPLPPARPAASPSAAEPASPPSAPAAASAAPGDGEPAAASGSGGTFGAEGDAAPVRDLGRAFTRAIPPACQADAAWAALPVGDAGMIEVAIAVDATGRIVSSRPLGEEAPPLHLAALVRRTVALLGAGTFAVKSTQGGAGTQVLRIRATVSDRPSEESGGEAGLAFQYDGTVGLAGFTQSGGRHVDVRVEVRPGG